jgi:hypothetical protein
VPVLLFLGTAVASGVLADVWEPLTGGAPQPAAAQTSNRTKAEHERLLAPCNTTDLKVERCQLRSGGPAKDGIHSITNPDTVPVGEADFLDPADRVVGVEIADRARAYPLRLLNDQEIVNNRLGDTLVAVIYCPLRDAASVVDRRIHSKNLEFGVSGLFMHGARREGVALS